MDWSFKLCLFISNVLLFLCLVMASKVFPLLVQSGGLAIACFRAFEIEEYLEVGSLGGAVDKLGEGNKSPGDVVD